jgi:hypothetical protein
MRQLSALFYNPALEFILILSDFYGILREIQTGKGVVLWKKVRMLSGKMNIPSRYL